jgi:hypothetical protein
MSESNFAFDTSSYPNQLEEFARRQGHLCFQNPAYKGSKYTARVAQSSETNWHISITHTDSLCDDAFVQPHVTDYGGHRGVIQEATDTVTPEKEILDLQRFIQTRQLEEEAASWDVEARLIPPPMPRYRIKVKLHFRGKAIPRIFFDSDRD